MFPERIEMGHWLKMGAIANPKLVQLTTLNLK